MSSSLSSELESLELLAKGDLPAEAVRQLADRLADGTRFDEVVASLTGRPGELVDALRRRPPGADPAADRLVAALLRGLGDVGSLDGASDNTQAYPPAPRDHGPPALLHLDTFKVEKILGQGGMGTVYLAVDPRLGRQVAIKTLKRELAEKPGAIDRFLREARTAARVEHDHICPIYHVGEDNGTPFIAMPFLKGEPLDAKLKREKPLPIPEAIRIGREVALGLAAAHEVGLIHRDIKPANVWLETVKGRPPRARILDFGLARGQADEGELTASGVILGTPAYMAPEQARGKKVDARADLWSLGVMLYEMAVGRRPFTGGDTMAILTSLAMDDPAPAHEANPAVPRELSALIHKLLSKNVEGRPSDGQAVADELMRIQTHATLPGIEALPAGPSVVSRNAQTVVDPWGGIEDESSVPDVKPVKAARPAKPAGAAGRFPWPLALALGVVVLLGGAFAAYKLTTKPKAGPEPATEPTREVAAARKDAPKPAMDPDRKAAEYALPLGAVVRVNDDNRDITTADELPKTPFRLASLHWTHNPNVTDAGLAHFSGCKNLSHLALDGASITDAALANFKDCAALKGLYLDSTKVTDAGLAHFKNCAALETLQLGNTLVGDAGLALFKDCDKLSRVGLHQTRVTDAGLKMFENGGSLRVLYIGSNPQLTDKAVSQLRTARGLADLDLSGTGVTDAGLALLAERPDLARLILHSNPQLTDAGVARLKSFKALADLDLGGTGLTDAGLAPLAECPNLARLSVGRTAVSDAGVKSLLTFGALRTLQMEKSAVTPAGVKQLAAGMPLCRIGHDGGCVEPTATADPDRTAAEALHKYAVLIVQVAPDKNVRVLLTDPLPAGKFALVQAVFYGLDAAPAPPPGFVKTTLLPALAPLKSFIGIPDKTDRLGLTDDEAVALAESPVAATLVDFPPVNPAPRVLAALGKLPRLLRVDVRAGGFGPGDLKKLVPLLPPQVTHLGLLSLGAKAKVDLEDFKAVTARPLHWVVLHECAGVTRDMAKELAKMPGLTNLEVSASRLEAGAVEDVCANRKLGHLDFQDSNVGDADLAHVAKLQDLSFVLLTGSAVTAAGVEKLRAALPKAVVAWRPADSSRRAAEAFKPYAELTLRLASGAAVSVGPKDPLPPGPFALESAFFHYANGYEKTPPGFVKSVFMPAVTPLTTFRVVVDSFDRIKFTDDEILQIAGLPCARTITHLPPINPTPRVLEALAKFPKIDFVSVRVPAAGTAELTALAAKIPPSVTHVCLYSLGENAKPGLAGFQAITALPVNWVSVRKPAAFTRDMAQALAKMPKLTNVDINYVAPEAGWVEDLAANPNLGDLTFQHTNVTDADLAHLAKLSKLYNLSLNGTKVTDAGVKKLAAALPRCRIEWDGGTITPK